MLPLRRPLPLVLESPVTVILELEVPLVVLPKTSRRKTFAKPVRRLPVGRPLTLNNAPANPHAKAELVGQIREVLGWSAKSAMLTHHLGRQDHITVQLHYRPGDGRRRDTDNLIASQKPAVDGLVDAGLIADDNPTHLTWWAPEIHLEPGTRRLWLTIQIPAA